MKKSIVRQPVLARRKTIGIDLAADTAVACVLDRAGTVECIKDLVLTPAALRAEFAGPPVVIVLEACNVSGWVARLLEELGHLVITCNPRRLKLIAESTLKTDALDAQTLARLGRLHQLDPKVVQPCIVRSRETQLRRSVLVTRDQMVQTRSKFVTLARSILRSDACPAPRCEAEVFAKKVRALDLPKDLRSVVLPLLDALDALQCQIRAVEDEIRAFAKDYPIIKKWSSIKGLGQLTCASFALTIEDPRRFPRARDVGAYLGFVPSVRASSEVERRGRCTKVGDARTRRYLIQAAMILMRNAQDSALKRWALALAKRVGNKKARVGLARKLAVVMLRMWLTGEDYVLFPSREVPAAA